MKKEKSVILVQDRRILSEQFIRPNRSWPAFIRNPTTWAKRSKPQKKVWFFLNFVCCKRFIKTKRAFKDPFVIHVERLNQDYLFPNVILCPYFGEAREFYEKLKLFKNAEYIENLKALNMALPIRRDDESTAPTSFTAFRDDLLARKVT